MVRLRLRRAQALLIPMHAVSPFEDRLLRFTRRLAMLQRKLRRKRRPTALYRILFLQTRLDQILPTRR